MPNIIYLINPEVNSGNVIRIDANSVTTKIECFTNVESLPKTSLTGSIASLYAKGRNTGFGNPVHSIRGVFDLNESHLTGSTAVFDYEYALELVKRSDQIIAISCNKWTTTDNPTGTLYCMLKNYSDSNKNDNTVSFTLEFQEVYNG